MKKFYVILLLAVSVSGNSYGMFEEVKTFGKNLCKSSFTTGKSAVMHYSSIVAPLAGYCGGYLVGLACLNGEAARTNCANAGLLLGINVPFIRVAYRDYKAKTQAVPQIKCSKWMGMVFGKALVFTTMTTASIGAYLTWAK